MLAGWTSLNSLIILPWWSKQHSYNFQEQFSIFAFTTKGAFMFIS